MFFGAVLASESFVSEKHFSRISEEGKRNLKHKILKCPKKIWLTFMSNLEKKSE